MAISRRTAAAVAATGLLALGVAPAPASGAARGAGPRIVDRAEDCDPMTPAVYNLNATGTPVAVQVLVLLEGIAKPEAEAIVEAAADSYVPLAVSFDTTYKKVAPEASVPGTEAVANAASEVAEARSALGGARPAGTDIVYLMTTKDLVIPSGDVVGYADCIGGVRFPNRAFAAGEAVIPTDAVGPLNFYVDAAAKTMGHEIGHLLGARHEHANCVQGVQVSDVTGADPTPCTLMINDVGVQSLNFGALEASVVRGYAEVFTDS